MIDDKRFFQDFFDGQIVKPESEKFKMFRLLLCSFASVLGLFLAIYGLCSWIEFALLEMGMIWNFYSKLSNRISLVLSVIVAMLYFYFASMFSVYGTGLVYVAFYIPLQLIALSKDYSDGDFIQIKKRVNVFNSVIFCSIYVLLFALIALIDIETGSKFVLFDSLAASTMVCSALLRNERYNEYYVFRVLCLIENLALWILVLVEFNSTVGLLIIVMYASYLIYDLATMFYQKTTYVNEYIIKVQEYNDLMNKHLIEEKLKAYKSYKSSAEKNK